MRIDEVRDQLTEAEFQTAIIRWASHQGWHVHHDRGDMRLATAGDPGFPDLVLARDGTVIFAEVKTAKGRVSRSQWSWIDALPGTDCYVWRPADWPQIIELLT